jgi:predicted metal-dependent hydrolase
MAGPCWNTRSPDVRSLTEAVGATQLDLFRRVGGSRAAPSPATDSGPAAPVEEVRLEHGVVPVRYERHPRARRYRLTLRPDGTARCTVPARGSLAEARRFVERSRDWLAQRLAARTAQPPRAQVWALGAPVWFRGQPTPLTQGERAGELRLGDWTFRVRGAWPDDLRPAVQRALWRRAAAELPARLAELAARHGYAVRRVSVRNQRTRWGSCSARGVISLNWRLVQTPEFVRDYILLHELAHTRHLNHSDRYWQEVGRVCPDYARAEAWLKTHGRELL